jgi:hypothetical protein
MVKPSTAKYEIAKNIKYEGEQTLADVCVAKYFDSKKNRETQSS